MSDFVHLHVHSEYSLLDGACRISELAGAVKNMGQEAVAITDHGVMYGAVEFYNACKENDIKPIIGCEVYVAPGSRFEKTRSTEASFYHLVLLCKNEIGYKNLIYMVSKSFTEGFYSKPRVDMELISEHSEGLICLSGCIAGYIPRMIAKERYDAAKEYALQMNRIFGEGNFYLEIQNHGIEDEKEIMPYIVQISDETGIELVATNDAHYIKRSDADTQAILMCVQTNRVITDGRPLGFETDEFYLKNSFEMYNLFGKYKNALSNTVRIAQMCNFEFDFSHIYLPKYQTENNVSPSDMLRKLAYDGFEKKIKNYEIIINTPTDTVIYKERIEYELGVIDKMGFNDYYLIVCDYVNFAKNNNVETGPGRGSGAGSLVAYLINITDVDAIRYNLMFERFLNPERVSMPDFDIDFCDEHRHRVIEYVTQKYGKDRVSQIATFGTLAARAAVRDVGRALGMSYSDVDAIAKMIPQELKITIKSALEQTRELKSLYESDDKSRRLIDVAMSVEGMPRNVSTHAAGVVITEKSTSSYVPLATSSDMTITQYDMDTIAKLGLVKFDFLGIRYLSIISNTISQIKEYDADFDLKKIDLFDSQTYDMLSKGNGDGIFQLESAGVCQLLTRLKPKSIEDITAVIALYRPGPMDSIPKFLENRADSTKIKYISEKLKRILDVTYGVVVYQEQVMEIFRELAGYSYGQADIVRRMMSKKKTTEMEKHRSIFLYGQRNETGECLIEGSVARGIDEKDADELFDEIAGFAKYAFNKSHAVSYAILAYRCAYLKQHYFAEYMSSLLTSVMGRHTKTAEYISSCQKNNISVLPPDINESNKYFHVTNNGGDKNIRLGLLAVKNVGINFVDNLINERKKGKFESFENFIERMIGYDSNKKQIESFIKCGVFDSLGVYRSQLLASYEKMIDMQVNTSKKNISGQIDIFSLDGSEDLKTVYVYPDLPEISLKEKLMYEKEATGQYFSGHFLDEYSENIKNFSHAQINDILMSFSDDSISNIRYKEKQIVSVCGCISKKVIKSTKNGDAMAFITLEDRYSEIEAIIFPKLFESKAASLFIGSALIVTGELTKREEEEPKILVKNIIQMYNNTEYKKRTVVQGEPKLYIKAKSRDSADYKKAENLIMIYNSDLSRTETVVFFDEEKKYYKLGIRVDCTELLIKELKKILGENAVVIKK